MITWRTIPFFKGTYPIETDLKISVIIPVLNEENKIADLLMDLEQQGLSHGNYEVIVVDDHSTDTTFEIVVDYFKTCSCNASLLTNSGKGKKEAIESGISKSKGQIIVTTDGDCRVGEHWLESIVTYMELSGVKILSGPVRFRGASGYWTDGLMMEFGALQAMGAATLSSGFPTMCNGANLAYYKEVFLEVGGFKGNKHILSGDDEFLLHRINNRFPGSAGFIKSSDAIVETTAPNSLTSFYNQRLRWASKWKAYESRSPIVIGLLVLLINLNIIFGGILWYLDFLDALYLLGFFAAKILIDYLLILAVNRFLKKRSNPVLWVFIEVIYPLYVIGFGILGIIGNYTWKGRSSTEFMKK